MSEDFRVHRLQTSGPLHLPSDALQAASHASGIDTGCCLGDQLTALVLPRLSELEARGWTPASCKEGVTREEIGAKLVSVNAREQYVKDDKE